MEVHAEDFWLICCGLLSIAFSLFYSHFCRRVREWMVGNEEAREGREWVDLETFLAWAPVVDWSLPLNLLLLKGFRRGVLRSGVSFGSVQGSCLKTSLRSVSLIWNSWVGSHMLGCRGPAEQDACSPWNAILARHLPPWHSPASHYAYFMQHDFGAALNKNLAHPSSHSMGPQDGLILSSESLKYRCPAPDVSAFEPESPRVRLQPSLSTHSFTPRPSWISWSWGASEWLGHAKE